MHYCPNVPWEVAEEIRQMNIPKAIRGATPFSKMVYLLATEADIMYLKLKYPTLQWIYTDAASVNGVSVAKL